MDLDGLAIFVKVAELMSFTRAAEHLGMPKARVSQRLAAHEGELGVRLLQRTTRTVRVTSDGEQLLPRAKLLVQDAEEVSAMFQDQRALRGLVRVDLPITFARELLIPRLPELYAMYPHLELAVSTTDRRVDIVAEGFDCVLSIGNLRASDLTAQRLGVLETFNVASPGYVKRHGLPRGLEDLDRHLIVHYAMTFGTDPPPGFEYRDGNTYRLRPMRSLITVNSADAYRAACLAGLGIIQAPNVRLRTDLEEGLFVEILPELRAEPMPVSLVHPHGRRVPKRVRAVMGWIASVITPRLGRDPAPS